MDYYAIGQQIRRARKARGVSQERLAELVNISTTHMSHIETGNTKLSLPVLVELAEVLEVRTDDLLGRSVYTGGHAAEEITALLEGCTPQEAKVLVELVKAARQAIRQYLL